MVKRIKLRTLAIGGLFTLLFIVIISRLIWYQVVNQEEWMKRAKSSWSTVQNLPAERGTIYDQHGEVLAMDAPAYIVAVSPRTIQELKQNASLIKEGIDVEREIVEFLHKALGKPEHELYDIVRSKDKGVYRIHREVRKEGFKIEEDKAKEIRAFTKELKTKTDAYDVGLHLMDESKRFYAKNNLATHVLGYINKEDKPVMGVETSLNHLLQGTPGKLQYEKDLRGNKLPTASEIYTPARDGKNVYLTIDHTIQQYIDEAMREVYLEQGPRSMTVIAADPKTGNILGMENMPNFNPNKYWEMEEGATRNPAIQALYEPGSTFKIITLAAAVQEGIFDPDATFMSGKIYAGGRPIGDHNSGRGWGRISYLTGLKRSSNVAFVKLGFEQLKEEKFTKYIRDFGFNDLTGITLPSEKSSNIKFEYPADLAAATYGHGKVLVTPIQQIMAVSAVANGGKLMKPNLIKKTVDPMTGEVFEPKPEVVREVISQGTAKQVSQYLEQVVSDQEIGTGKHAYIDGYRVAGKTGTAIKVVNGEYSSKHVVASFIGYAPVEDPRIAVIVVVDEPEQYLASSSITSGVFKKIVSQSLSYMGVPMSNDGKVAKNENGKDAPAVKGSKKAPNVQGVGLKDAKQRLAENGIAFETIGSTAKVKQQYPAPGDWLAPGQRMYLLTDDPSKMSLPSLVGKSLRDVMEIASLLKWEVRAEGEGYVTEQKTITEKGKRIVQVKLAPKAN
ncbi:penicillin-binding transpeptidase domain-containing protein [Paenibacillus sp. 481]|uniref:penicillin-binding transpeptidase domain-containing protein n=1 Tax=Paenibacillus sp. 481 TaxID=2835869 RepID=UPI001E4B6A07|nr:penicillin-binding transpeptidase domain-containing protein [Paenibacillus sp. 481]UHA74130.1 stage V sporulation protein D [Paenibacillus sp. 481]